MKRVMRIALAIFAMSMFSVTGVQAHRFTDITENYMNGSPHKLSQYVGRGNYVPIDIWASWCGSCMEEIANCNVETDNFVFPQNTNASAPDKEIAKENKCRQEVAQQHDRIQTVYDDDKRKVIGVYLVKDAVKTTYLKLDMDGTVYFKYEGKCLGKEYHNAEYVYWGSWKIERSTLGKSIKLEQDMESHNNWLYIYFPCYKLIESMQYYTSLVIDLNDGCIYGGRCRSSLKTTKIQTPQATQSTNSFYETELEVDEIPQFPGGQTALLQWLGQNIHYPAVAEEQGIQGRVVVSFVVEKDGSKSSIQVVRGVDPSLDKEAVRVVKLMPYWIPAKLNGFPVRYKYTIPVTFRYTDDTFAAPPSHTYSSDVSFTAPPTTTYTVKGVLFKMIGVEGGSFMMGDNDNRVNPIHQVTLSSFSIGETEVTQALWKAVMGSNPSKHKGDNLPVERVSWEDCQKFIQKLNLLTGKSFRLPTEAEWEYAASGGSRSKNYKYAGSNELGSVAWYNDNSGRMTHPVAEKQANELGLYDMSGNVYEWCNDWAGKISSSSQINPRGDASGHFRVYRGGGWGSGAGRCRVSSRGISYPGDRDNDLGLRLAL